MARGQAGKLCNILFLLGAGTALAACGHAEAVSQKAGEAPAPAAAAAETPVARPMTREQASTDCWMKYEKEGRHLSLDQRLPLVEKCTAEKLKAASR